MENEIENLIEELTKVSTEMLSKKGLKLFNTIMIILDERDNLKKENELYKLIIGQPPLYESEIIPKSKIKEKIEELETKLKVFEKDIRYCKERVQARLMNDEIYVLRRCRDLLKELMEDK